MMTRWKKLAALGVAIGGIAVLLGAGYALRRPILEQWYLFLLQSEDEGYWRPAFEYLADAGSVQAIPRVLEIIKNRVENDDIIYSEHMGMVLLLDNSSIQAVPVLMGQAQSEDETIRRLGILYLSVLGPKAQNAIPILEAAKNDQNQNVQNAVVKALRKIRGE